MIYQKRNSWYLKEEGKDIQAFDTKEEALASLKEGTCECTECKCDPCECVEKLLTMDQGRFGSYTKIKEWDNAED
jgi:hypothetical protein|tara:strand:+ start:75 stop:299 length:225 start_codon:yes stop_codon:yes gene_type:complete